MKDEHYYNDLLKRYIENRCSPPEVIELMNFLEKDSSKRLLLMQIKEQFYKQPKEDPQISIEQTNRIRKNLSQKIDNETPHLHMLKRQWKWPAAAAVLLVVSGFYLSKHLFTWKPSDLSRAGVSNKVYKNDVLPGSDKALLTLADGSTVSLDSSENGRFLQQGSSRVIIKNGKLAYATSGAGTNETLYNIVSTPPGGQYHIVLSDGSQVWLNTSSSLRFPTRFSGNERSVEMTGEAYFEVAKSQHTNFIVKVNKAMVQVLGTHFNVMAYPEEASVNTTLLEGSVKFMNETGNRFLKPGQQSQLTKDGQINLMNDVDVKEVVAWKNGFFHFETANLESVLRQISRWYDVEIIYKNKKADDLFYVDIPRNTVLSEALKVLKLASGAQFVIEGKKIIVQ